MTKVNDVKLVIAEPQAFIDCIGSICKLVDETNIVVKPTHVEIMAMDPANVAMVVFKMMSSEFVEYKVEGESGESVFGLKLSGLRQILSRGGKDNILTLVIQNNQLVVVFSGKTRKQFTLSLIDVDSKAKMPSLTFNSEVIIENSELKDAIADATIVGEAAELKVEVDKFIVSATSDSGSKMFTETKSTSINRINTKDAKAKYSIEYLDKMTGTKLAKNVKVHLGIDYPLKLTYVNDKGSISIEYILAPRVDNS